MGDCHRQVPLYHQKLMILHCCVQELMMLLFSIEHFWRPRLDSGTWDGFAYCLSGNVPL